MISAGIPDTIDGKLSKRIVGWGFKNAEITQVISESLRPKVQLFGARNIRLIPNGFDDEIFLPLNKDILREKYQISRTARILITVARLHPIKGLGFLIKAVSLIVQEIPDIQLFIIGDGPQRGELENLIHHNNIEKNVKLLGFKSQDQIINYLNISDVFILPSIHEAFGIALVEAMACGLPSVASNVDGIKDIIIDNREGVLVPPGDEKMLAKSILALINDNPKKERLSRQGRIKVKENYSWRSVLSQMESLYQEAVSQHGYRDTLTHEYFNCYQYFSSRNWRACYLCL